MIASPIRVARRFQLQERRRRQRASEIPGEILPESDSDSTWSPGGVDSLVRPEGEGSQTPPQKNRDGEELGLGK